MLFALILMNLIYFLEEIEMLKQAYQVICSDLDGTLLNSQKKISLSDRLAIDQWQSSGKLFGITSGRSDASIKAVTRDLIRRPDFIVALNEAEITTIEHQKQYYSLSTLQSKKILKRLATESYQQLTITMAGVVFRVVERLRTDSKDEISLESLLNNGLSRPIEKISIKTATRGSETYFYQLLSDLNVELTISDQCYVEATALGVNKLSGLKAALGLKCNLAEVAAVGDYWNDLAMIQGVGQGYAVENAVDGIKDVADKIIETHDDDPLKQIIEDLEC